MICPDSKFITNQDEVPSFFKVYSGAFDGFFGAISQRFSDASVTIDVGI